MSISVTNLTTSLSSVTNQELDAGLEMEPSVLGYLGEVFSISLRIVNREPRPITVVLEFETRGQSDAAMSCLLGTAADRLASDLAAIELGTLPIGATFDQTLFLKVCGSLGVLCVCGRLKELRPDGTTLAEKCVDFSIPIKPLFVCAASVDLEETVFSPTLFASGAPLGLARWSLPVVVMVNLTSLADSEVEFVGFELLPKVR